MTHTNRVRVVLGGLLGGLVINIVEFITNGVVLREAWARRCRRWANQHSSPLAQS
jgi:hypothetical protein